MVPADAVKILCIDDEPMIVGVVSRIMHDHEVVEYTDACAAIAHLTGAGDPHYDVIMCDVLMPDCSGMDVYRSLCEKRPGLASRVVFSTGASVMPRIDSFLESVPNRRIDKPFKIDHLRSVLLEVGKS